MRAALARAWGGPDQIELADVPEPVPGPGQVVVEVRAVALNRPDLLVMANEYQVSVPPPFVIGSEFAGRVRRVGDGVDAALLGRRVCGAALTGAFAEQVLAPASELVPVPEELSWCDAAAFSVCYRTAYHALVSFGQLRAGAVVIVLGAAGGVGSACVDVAVALGARVVAVATGADRMAFVAARGAHVVLDREADDLKGRLKRAAPDGADIVIDTVSGASSDPALRTLAWGGRFIVVGFASGEIARLPLNLVLLKGVQILGFELRTLARHRPDLVARADRDLAELVADGLRPAIGAVHDLDDIAVALSDLRDNRVMGKSVIRL